VGVFRWLERRWCAGRCHAAAPPLRRGSSSVRVLVTAVGLVAAGGGKMPTTPCTESAGSPGKVESVWRPPQAVTRCVEGCGEAAGVCGSGVKVASFTFAALSPQQVQHL